MQSTKRTGFSRGPKWLDEFEFYRAIEDGAHARHARAQPCGGWMKSLAISEFKEKVRSGEISVLEHTHKILEEIESSNKKYHHFCLVAKENALSQAMAVEKKIKKGFDGFLLGVPVSVKDSICVKGVESRAGSKILSGFIPLSNATCIEKAVNAGAIVVGKTSQDEFGFGSYSVNVGIGFEVPKNPVDENRSCGGSSGGCAGFTALTSFTHVSFGESTGGSIAPPASLCGVVGLTPSYGRISRNGLIDYGNSLDKIGPMSKTVEDSAILLEAVSGFDGKDATSSTKSVDFYSSFVGKSVKGKTIGVVKEFSGGALDKEIEKLFFDRISELEKEGLKIKEVSLALNAEYAIPAYYLMSTPEVSTNLARYCGMRYGLQENLEGSFNEYFSQIRSNAFGMEVKRRLMLGTFARMSGFRDAFYMKALKVRAKLLAEFRQAFKKVDLIANPTMPFVAPLFSEISKLTPIQHYYSDLYVCPANIAGLPHINVPVGKSKGMPVGMLFTAPHFEEKELVKIGSAVEAL